MSRFRRGVLQVEPLEGKVLLSTAAASARRRAAEVAPQPFSIAGTLKMPTNTVATFTLNGQNMGTFRLSGKLGSMGQVNGKFVAVLDANNDMTAGSLVLTGRRGRSRSRWSTTRPTRRPTTARSPRARRRSPRAAGRARWRHRACSAGGRIMKFAVAMA